MNITNYNLRVPRWACAMFAFLVVAMFLVPTMAWVVASDDGASDGMSEDWDFEVARFERAVPTSVQGVALDHRGGIHTTFTGIAVRPNIPLDGVYYGVEYARRSSAGGWANMPVACNLGPDGDFYEPFGIAVDAAPVPMPYVFYASNYELFVAHLTPTGWERQVSSNDPVGPVNSAGVHVGSDGKTVHVLATISPGNNSRLWYATWDGDSPMVVNLEYPGFGAISAPKYVLDSQDNIHLTYSTYGYSTGLWYATRDHLTGTWTTEQVIPDTVSGYKQIVVDSVGRVHIFATIGEINTNRTLSHIYKDETGEWRNRTVDTLEHGWGVYIALGSGIDGNGGIHVVYSTNTGYQPEPGYAMQSLKYAYLAPGSDTWEAELVYWKDNVGSFQGTDIGKDGSVHIVFYHGVPGGMEIVYASKNADNECPLNQRDATPENANTIKTLGQNFARWAEQNIPGGTNGLTIILLTAITTLTLLAGNLHKQKKTTKQEASKTEQTSDRPLLEIPERN